MSETLSKEFRRFIYKSKQTTNSSVANDIDKAYIIDNKIMLEEYETVLEYEENDQTILEKLHDKAILIFQTKQPNLYTTLPKKVPTDVELNKWWDQQTTSTHFRTSIIRAGKSYLIKIYSLQYVNWSAYKCIGCFVTLKGPKGINNHQKTCKNIKPNQHNIDRNSFLIVDNKIIHYTNTGMNIFEYI